MRAWLCALSLILCGPLRADHYLVDLPFLDPIIQSDGATARALLEPDRALRPISASEPAAIAPVTAPPPPDAPPPAERAALARGVEAAPPAGPSIGMDEMAAPRPGPPTAEVLEILRRTYFITAPAEIEIVWAKFNSEKPTLPFKSRIGNAVTRFIVGLGHAPAGDPTARPDRLKPGATRATVRAINGVGVRSEPGGAVTGSIPRGASVQVIPPAEDVWYRVRTGSGTGWVSGLWLELE